MSRTLAILLMLVAATAACASYPPVVDREADVALLADTTAAADSAVYAAFLETLNRDPRNDTLHVEEMSKVFVKLPSHYDSVAPGLNAALARLSKTQRPSSSLHLPPPVRVLPPAVVIALSNADVLNSLGAVEGKPQGVSGLWTFTPIAYSADGKDAMFSYTAVCGRRCGEDVVVWARKNAVGKWEVRKTAIIDID
jgi:hypothetical protein